LHIFAFLPLGDQRIALKFLSLCQETSLSYHGLLPETHKIIRNIVGTQPPISTGKNDLRIAFLGLWKCII
jgi:hypothetical protein